MMNFRNRSGQFAKDAGVMGGQKCPYCQRRIGMGAVDEHRCMRTTVCISLARAELKRIDALATAAGMTRSEYLTKCALSAVLSADELRLLEVVRGMKR